MGSANVILYAQGAFYTVTYNKNGATQGTAPVDSTRYAPGGFVNLYLNNGTPILDKFGENAIGWNTKADGTGTSYNFGASAVQINQNFTFYVKWQAVTVYKVIFEKGEATSGNWPSAANNSLSGTQKYAEVESGASFTMPPNDGNLVKSGTAATAWNTISNGSGTTYNFNQAVTVTGTFLVYPKF